MAIGPEATDAAMSAKDNAMLWKGVMYGGIFSALISVVLFVVSMVFADFWNALPFRMPKYTHRLTGSGFRVFKLKGATIKSGQDTPFDLAKDFPRPSDTDAVEYTISDAELCTKRNHDALLKAVLTWTVNGKRWQGTVFGRGRYFPKAPDVFNGYVYLVCDCKATFEKSVDTWKVIYVLRTKRGLDGWEGYWLRVDSFDPDHTKFGKLDLSIA